MSTIVATGELYRDIIKRVVPSIELSESLMKRPMSKQSLIEVILGSPISLKEKLAIFERLAVESSVDADSERSNKENDDRERKCAGHRRTYARDLTFAACAEEIRKALDALVLDTGEVLILCERSYSDDPDGRHGEFGYDGFAPYASYDALKSFVDHELRGCDEADLADALFWYEIEKWVPYKEGFMLEEYEYVLIGEEPTFFSHRIPGDGVNVAEDMGICDLQGFDDSGNLCLYVPYEPGDIVKVDCRPFSPVRYACLFDFWGIAPGEVAALFRNHRGLWVNRSLGRNFNFEETHHLSVLYRIAKAEEELPVEDRLLYEVQHYVNGSNDRGETLWRKLEGLKDELTDEELMRAICECRG